jgi:hypothetical protein
MGPCKPQPEPIARVLGGPQIRAVMSSRVIEVEKCYGGLMTCWAGRE